MAYKDKNRHISIRIRNMVCDRCIATVRRSLSDLGAADLEVSLGLAQFSKIDDLQKITSELEKHGFEVIQDAQDIKVEQIKIYLQSLLANVPLNIPKKLSALLSEQFSLSYVTLSKLFSQHEDVTIERYFLLLKLEKVKELIQEGQMNFTEIAHTLDYASVNHLSRQFKVHMGVSLSDYKKQGAHQRKPIDKIV